VDPAAPALQRRGGIAPAEREVAGVEQQADVGELEQALDLPRCLDVRRRVVVERRFESSGPCELGSPGYAVGQPAPAVLVEADRAVRRGAPWKADALGRARVGQHGL